MAPTAREQDGGHRSSAPAIVAKATRSFIRQVFINKEDMGIAATPAPTQAGGTEPQPRRAPATTKARRASVRLAKKPSAVPVSLRATHRLIKELDIGAGDGPVAKEVLAEYLSKFGKALTARDLAALSKVTWLDSAQLTLAMQELAQEEHAADDAAA